jgi:hypothetical protein
VAGRVCRPRSSSRPVHTPNPPPPASTQMQQDAATATGPSLLYARTSHTHPFSLRTSHDAHERSNKWLGLCGVLEFPSSLPPLPPPPPRSRGAGVDPCGHLHRYPGAGVSHLPVSLPPGASGPPAQGVVRGPRRRCPPPLLLSVPLLPTHTGGEALPLLRGYTPGWAPLNLLSAHLPLAHVHVRAWCACPSSAAGSTSLRSGAQTTKSRKWFRRAAPALRSSQSTWSSSSLLPPCVLASVRGQRARVSCEA